MNCPHCRVTLDFRDRICRKCRYFLQESRVIEIEPRRAPPPAVRALTSLKPLVIFPAALIPGGGHLVTGQWIKAGLYFALTVGLLTVSLMGFNQTIGRMLFGLAVSAHAYSIFDLTPWNRTGPPWLRGAIMGGLLLGLMLAYWPFLGWMVETILASEASRGGHRFEFREITFGQILFMAVTFLITFWVTARMSRKIWDDSRT